MMYVHKFMLNRNLIYANASSEYIVRAIVFVEAYEVLTRQKEAENTAYNK